MKAAKRSREREKRDIVRAVVTKITKQNRLFESFNSTDKLSFLFSNSDPRISKLAAGFIFKANQ